MAGYIATLKDDLKNGFSKTQLEILIDLPKNSLASVLTGKRKLSPKSILKIKKWEASEKPNPLEIVLEKKIEKVLAESKGEVNKIQDDISTLGVSVHETTLGENGKVKIRHVDPLSDEGLQIRYKLELQNQISEIEEKLKLPAKYLPASKRKPLENQLSNLKYQLNEQKDKL